MTQNASGEASNCNAYEQIGLSPEIDMEDLPERKYRNKEWLKHQYHTLGKSAREIADENGWGSTTVNTWIDKHNIKKRPFGEIISSSKQKDKKWYDKDWLKQKYISEKLTMREMADEAGVDVNSIRRGMREAGIETRDRGYYNQKGGPWDNKEWLYEQYVTLEKSAPDIAKEQNISQSLVYDRLIEYNIERRKEGVKGSRWKNERKYTTESWLRKQYYSNEKNATEIASECNISRDTVYHWMDKVGIERRNRSELVGELATNWKGGRATGYGPNWRQQRRKARERDNHTCQDCGLEYGKDTPRKLDVHHIVPFKEFDNYDEANRLDNLVTLCRTCHNKWEGLYLRPDKDDL